jgi:hypothetical protein
MVLLVQSEGDPNLPTFLKVGPKIVSSELSAYSLSRKDSDAVINNFSASGSSGNIIGIGQGNTPLSPIRQSPSPNPSPQSTTSGYVDISAANE